MFRMGFKRSGFVLRNTVILLLLNLPVLGESELVTTEIAPQGFGDPQNSAAWSMRWWNGKLYVGTVRSWFCWSAAIAHKVLPSVFPYPPADGDVQCTLDPLDLPLQAEIWRWTPETNRWELAFRSPASVPVSDQPGKFTAREVGFRDMVVFRERDGTEALYVSSVSPDAINPNVGPPRILRSTDGSNFLPIPQDPGTMLGDFEEPSFRGITVYKNRLYVIGGNVSGSGALLESIAPALGNDSYRVVSPPGMLIFEAVPYNGFLYVGTNDRTLDVETGYEVLKTDATGTPPYSFTPVVRNGAFLPDRPSRTAVSMHEFDGRLYVGTNTPAELIRINPDDTWELIVGEPRSTPSGWKFPLSGFGAGFNWPFNMHLWRMQDHDGVLFVGTADRSIMLRDTVSPDVERLLSILYGFDLFQTENGWFFTPITLTGFKDEFQLGVRTMASVAEQGLFLGSADLWKGLRIWRGQVVKSPFGAPQRLEAEGRAGSVLLAWDRGSEAVRYHVFRSSFEQEVVDPETGSVRIPGPFTKVGTTIDLYFADAGVLPGMQYQYYIVAEGQAGAFSNPSNIVPGPSLASPASFGSIDLTLQDWSSRVDGTSRQALTGIRTKLADAKRLLQAGDLAGALQAIERLRREVIQSTAIESWRGQDLEVLLSKLFKRIRLGQAGLIPSSELG